MTKDELIERIRAEFKRQSDSDYDAASLTEGDDGCFVNDGYLDLSALADAILESSQ